MTYRILITGSRTWTDEGAIWDALNAAIDQATTQGEREFVVVHGDCPRGADAQAAAFCEDQSGWYDNAGYTLAEERHPADWTALGRRAGYARNAAMVALGADVCLAFIGPCHSPKCGRLDAHGSHGATHCAAEARRAGIEVRRWPR